LYLNYEGTESSDIQNQNLASLNDFKNSFITSQFEYTAFADDDILFPARSSVRIKAGFGSRKSADEKINQQLYQANAMHTFILNQRNHINIRSHNFFLQSD